MENKVMLLGRIGSDPEKRDFTRKDGSQFSVCKISLATTPTSWTNKETKERVTPTQWHRVSFIGNLAEVVARGYHKGDLILVHGFLDYETRKIDINGDIVHGNTYNLAVVRVDSRNGGSVKKIINQQRRKLNADEYDDDASFNDDENSGFKGKTHKKSDDLDHLKFDDELSGDYSSEDSEE